MARGMDQSKGTGAEIAYTGTEPPYDEALSYGGFTVGGRYAVNGDYS